MRFLTTVTPGPMPPPVEVLRASQEWLKGKMADGTFECVYAFVDGGGCSISSYDSLEDLQADLLEYPASPFISYSVRPLVDLDQTLDRVAERMEQLAAQAS